MIAPACNAVVDMVMDQRTLRLGHRAFDGMQLRGKVKARPPLVNHADDAAQMPLGAFQPGGDGRVACVNVVW